MPNQNALRRFAKQLFVSLLSVLLIVAVLQTFALAQTAEPKGDNDEGKSEPDLHLMRRINAHGDEFNAVVLSPDERRLVIGTEKGELIVWGIAEQQVVLRFNQGSPIHALVMLGDGRRVVAAGGPHGGAKRAGVVRCWNLETGAFQEWRGLESDTIGEMAIDRKSGLVAAGAADGHVAVWNAETGKLAASWNLENLVVGLAVIGHHVFATTINRQMLDEDSDDLPANAILVFDVEKPKDEPRELVSAEREYFWGRLIASPDGKRLVSICLNKERKSRVALLDPGKGTETESFEASGVVWFADDGLILHNSTAPEQIVRLKAEGKALVEKRWDADSWHRNGDPDDLGGLVASRDASTFWGVFKKGAAIVRWTAAEKRGEILTMTRGNLYAMGVIEAVNGIGSGLVLTGGDDGFARVWNLSDLSLRNEFKVPVGVPQGVALLEGGRQAVVSCGTNEAPTEIVIADTDTGAQRKLLSIDEPFVRVYAAGNNFVYGRSLRVMLASSVDGRTLHEFTVGSEIEKFAVSANGKWLAIADAEGKPHVFEIASGRKTFESKEKIEALTDIAISNDGRRVFTTEFHANLKRWDVQSGSFEQLTGVHGQCRSLGLSSDERFILVGGNHRDFAIYDAKSGDRLAAFATEAADFSVTNIWMNGDRLIFTTDTGVLLEGRLEKPEKSKDR